MPMLRRSLAAAAAAADAYLSPSPAGRVGTAAGFIVGSGGKLVAGSWECNDASVGNGDLSCADGRLPPLPPAGPSPTAAAADDEALFAALAATLPSVSARSPDTETFS